MKNRGNKRIIQAVVFTLLLAFTSPLQAFAEDERQNLPFDPAKIEKNNCWQEEFLHDGLSYQWCGKKNLLFTHGKLISMESKNKRIRVLARDSKSNSIMIGCTPDSLYLFALDYTPIERGNPLAGRTIVLNIYNTKTLKKVKSFDAGKVDTVAELMSPSGKYLVWHFGGEIILDKTHTVKLLPSLKVFENRIMFVAWSDDEKKVYIAPYTDYFSPFKIFEYEVATGKSRKTRIILPNEGEILNLKIAVYPSDVLGLYFDGWTSNEIFRDKLPSSNLYRVNLATLDWSKEFVKAKHIMSSVDSFDINSSGDLLFTIHLPKYPNNESDYGIYLLNNSTQKIRRISKHYGDSDPLFSNDGKSIAFNRIVKFKGEVGIYNIFILQKQQKEK